MFTPSKRLFKVTPAIPAKATRSRTPLRGQAYNKPDINSSLFSDSMDDFIGDFTMSDADEDVNAFNTQPDSQKTQSNKSASEHLDFKTANNNTQPVSTVKLVAQSSNSAFHSTVKADPCLAVKPEPTTPPNPVTNFSRRKGICNLLCAFIKWYFFPLVS